MKVVGFWIVAAILIALALIALLPALLRRHRIDGPDRRQVNAAVYRARLKELEDEVAAGALDPADVEQARAELEREMLESLGASPDPELHDGIPPRRAAAVLAVLLPVLAVGIYLQLGEPESILVERPAPENALTPGGLADGNVERAELKRMVESFAERLRNAPEESKGDGWFVLGRSYVVLEEYDKAVLAFAHAHMLLGDTPDLLVDYAEAEALANRNIFTDAGLGRLEKALELDPDHEKGLWLAAFAAAQRGESEVALARWRRLLAREDDPDRRALIEGLIARVENAVPPQAQPAPAASGHGGRVQVSVAVANSLADGLDGSETVFVFARAVDGPRLPLAVSRTRVDALPATVVLDDSMAMTPEFKLSDQDRVMVVARVSRTGDAQARSGDLEGRSGPVPVGADAPVQVIIDKRVP